MNNPTGIDDILMATDAPFLLSQLTEYHDTMEAQLQSALHAQRANITPQTDDGVIKTLFLNTKYQHTFANLLRYSIVTSAYGICERALHQLCQHAKERMGLRFDPCDVKSNGEIERFKIYLDKSGVDIGDLDCWSFLADLGKLRNAIVHAGGGFLGEPEHAKHINHVKSIVNRLPGLSITEDFGITEIDLDRDLCSSVINRVSETIEAVFSRIHKLVNEEA